MISFRNISLAAAGLMVLALVAGCKKEQKAVVAEENIIPLQQGVMFLGAQMEGNTVWISSYDPKTKACLLRHYDLRGELIIDSPRIRLRGCQIDQALLPPPQQQTTTPKPATKTKS